ncbi:hypothetical protein ACFL16_01015 [Patescibacteria group bacterium]
MKKLNKEELKKKIDDSKPKDEAADETNEERVSLNWKKIETGRCWILKREVIS